MTKIDLEALGEDGGFFFGDDFGEEFVPQISYKMVEALDSYRPIPHRELPGRFSDAIDSSAIQLLTDNGGKVIVTGGPGIGKTFFIHQIVNNMPSYTKKTGRGPIKFVIPQMEFGMNLNLHQSYGLYIMALCRELECREQDICFVTEDPSVAAAITMNTNKAMVLLEVSTPTFIAMVDDERSGSTKVWSSWEAVDAGVTVPREDLGQLMRDIVIDTVRESFRVEMTPRSISLFISHALRKMPALEDSEGYIVVPMGLWARALKKVGGMMGLSESLSIRSGNKVAVGKVIESVFEEMSGIFVQFIENEEGHDHQHVVVMGPDGPIHVPNPKSKSRGPVEPVEFRDLSELSKTLHEQVLGQEEAIHSVTNELVIPAAGLHDENKPLRSMLFLGSTGVGKTKLATVLAENVATKPMNLIRVDMSEYGQAHEAAKLLGAPPGYTGFEQGGTLTNAVMEHPHSVILLDEVEKAHPKIWDSFLQVLDAGRMTDGTGNLVDFTQTIIIMTSNLGSGDAAKAGVGFSGGFSDSALAARQKDTARVILKAVESSFKPEFVNRIGRVVIFNELSKDTARKIVSSEFDRLAARMARTGFSLNTVSGDIVDSILVKSNFSKYGARDIQRVLDERVSGLIAREIISNKGTDKRKITLHLDDDNNVSAVPN